MTCFHPLSGYRTDAINPDTGKRGLTFNPLKSVNSALPLKLACGQCRGCRHDRAAAWSVRLGHEAKISSCASFITLTYEDDKLPSDYSVHKRDFQLFMKRLRAARGGRIRFFGVGEYGDDFGRPHYHALLFGEAFYADRKPWAKRNGHQVYRSDALESLWPFGHSELGSVTAASAGYVARYSVKKMTGDLAKDHYLRPSPVDGKMHQVEPEFAVMSRRPGIGTEWFNRFAGDAFPSDFLIVDGRRKPVPSFYLRKLPDADSVDASSVPEGRLLRELAAPSGVKVKRSRKLKSAQPRSKAERSKERLAVREEVHRLRVNRLVRSL